MTESATAPTDTIQCLVESHLKKGWLNISLRSLEWNIQQAYYRCDGHLSLLCTYSNFFIYVLHVQFIPLFIYVNGRPGILTV